MALITDLDDRTLVEQHRAGDADAFRRIVERHHRSLYANALRRLGDPVAAEDAVQDAFLRAFRNIERFDGDYHLDAWLHRIVTNTCHDIGRRRGRDTRLFDRACTEIEVEAAPADEAMDAVPREQITEALDALPESYREVLMLRFVDELPYADVAEKAGISEQNARARVSRGRTMLKRMLTSTSALVVWAIPPLRRQTQLTGAEAEAANQAASQVHSLATIAASAPAPTHAFSQVSGIIAQAGPAIATAAPAASSTAPAFGKAAMAVGLAAAAAIPAGVAVDRAREKPAPMEERIDETAIAAADAPVTVESTAKPAPSIAVAPAPVTALSSDDGMAGAIADVSTTTAAPTSSVPPTSDPAPTTSTPSGESESPASSPAPAPSDEQPVDPAPTPEPATPGQLSASLTVTTVGDELHISGPLSLVVGERTVAGRLEGKIGVVAADPKNPEAPRQVERSVLFLDLEDGTSLKLTVQGWSTVTTQGSTESHALDLAFMLPDGAAFELAEDGQLEGTLVVKHGTGELGLALPGATSDS